MVYPSMTDRKRRPARLEARNVPSADPASSRVGPLRETPMLRRGLAASDGRGGRHGPPQPCLYRLVHPVKNVARCQLEVNLCRPDPISMDNESSRPAPGRLVGEGRTGGGRSPVSGRRSTGPRISRGPDGGGRLPHPDAGHGPKPAPGRRSDRSGLPAPGHRTEEPAPGRRTGSRPAPALGAGLGRSFVARSVVARRDAARPAVSRRSGTGSSRSSRRAGPSVA